MPKMSKLWYEARDATDSGKYKETRTCILREYLAELGIVQPWESDPKCIDAVDKKHSMMNKLKKEIERRRMRNLARLRRAVATVLLTVIGGLILLIIQRVAFPDKNQPNKETEKTAPQKSQESISVNSPNIQATGQPTQKKQ